MSGKEKTNAALTAARFSGHNTADYFHVGYVVEAEGLAEERQALTNELDRMNHAPGDWRHEFRPFLSLATLHHRSAERRVVDAFREIMPETVTLYGARAQAN